MRSARNVFIAVAVMVAFAGVVLAADKPAEVTLSGEVQCAKCTLKKADAKACQDVLVVPGQGGAPATEYYLSKNTAAKGFGHVCNGTKSAVATGTVAEKDGKKWLSASKIEEKKN